MTHAPDDIGSVIKAAVGGSDADAHDPKDTGLAVTADDAKVGGGHRRRRRRSHRAKGGRRSHRAKGRKRSHRAKGRKNSKRRRRSHRKGGQFGAVVRQALVPFGLYATQKRVHRRHGRKTKHRRGRRHSRR